MQKLTLLKAGLLIVAFLTGACRQQAPAATTVATRAATATSPPATATTTAVATPTTASPTPEETAADEETSDSADEGAMTGSADEPFVDDFESQRLPTGSDNNATIGFLTWSDGSPISIKTVSTSAGDELALPDQEAENTILQLNTGVGASGWAGFTHAFADDSVTQWTPRDWSGYEGVSLWLFGQDSGGTLFIDLLDNREPDTSGDTAERWSYDIPDDFAGWQYFEIPFEDFRRKEIGNGAPNDGLNLDAVHGYAVGAFGSVAMGPQTHYVDRVTPYGIAPVRPVEVSFTKNAYSMRETGHATIRIELSKPATETVTVSYAAHPSWATAGWDYEPVGGTLTFEPGVTEQAFTVNAIDDARSEGSEQLLLVLTDVQGAVFGFQRRAPLTIRDDENPDPMLLLDFETAPPLRVTGGVSLTHLAVQPGDTLARPDQQDPEQLLALSTAAGSGSIAQQFGSPRDWSKAAGVSFWFYGQNSGETVRFELLANQAESAAESTPGEWQLVWQDEFDGPAGQPPDPAIWQPEIGDGTLNGISGWGNNELEYYTGEPENAALDGEGHLAITARAVNTSTTDLICWYGPCEYTSARLITWHRLEQTFGRIEARLKLPAGQGIWPAFWMLGTNLDEVGWPQSGEIDIIENIGREPDTVHGTIHGPGYSGGNAIGASSELEGANFADDFHVFAIEWEQDVIRWYVDGALFFTATPDSLPPGGEWVYNHPFFIILNLAVGGNWPGYPDSTTTFPQTLLVDYVRSYGTPNSSQRFSATFEDSFTGWQQVELPFSLFTRSDNQPPGAPDGDLSLDEIWGYRFLVPAAAQDAFYLDQLQLIP